MFRTLHTFYWIFMFYWMFETHTFLLNFRDPIEIVTPQIFNNPPTIFPNSPLIICFGFSILKGSVHTPTILMA